VSQARPIAIVGMDCRFPGGADSPQKYWTLLDSGRHFSSPLPVNRGWDLAWLQDPEARAMGRTRISRGSFLDDVSGFDAGFFGVSPREAVLLDPQQRLLLESTWKAIESARIAPESLRGSRTGVYVGIAYYSYGAAVGRQPWSGDADVYIATGATTSVASGRISHALDLRGPAFSVDTACSSGLVAAHMAVRALRAGECDLAIVGGVCVMASPDVFVGLGRAGALSGDGRSKAFSANADGFAPSEGVATLLLMPLDRAIATGRPVLAVVRGSATNNDGTGEGLTIPSGAAQQALIAEALEDAGLSPDQVDLVEAHGTGTKVGDPIEARSIQAAYGSARTPDLPVWIGSAKSNIGHAQAAAGLAGLIKVVLALRHERMPATLHVEDPTEEVDWSPGTMRLLQQARDWPRGDRVRRGGVLAYGISGTNAHMILEEAPEAALPILERITNRGTWAWPLSAKSDSALRGQSAALAEWIRDHPDLPPADIGWSLAATRSALVERAVVVGDDTAALLEGLAALAHSGGLPKSAGARARARDVGQPVFVFPGQGGQWLGMGARLLEESAVFADAIESCAEALRPWIDFDVVDVLRGRSGASGFESAEVVQPASFAMYVALAELWRAHGVRPAAVIGHSQGEIAAAYVAGALTLEDAARVVTARSGNLRKISGTGAMVSVALPEQRAADLLRRWHGRLVIAAVNGPASTTVAGDTDAADELLRHCEDTGVWVKRVPVDYASHSPHVDFVRDEVLEGMRGITSREPSVRIFSSTTGEPADGLVMDADYWYQGLRQPVLFENAVRHALRQGHKHFIEVSPHPILTSAVRDIAADLGVEVGTVQTLGRDDGDMSAFTRALATAHVCGIQVDWSAVYPGADEVDLPTYQFQQRRFWHDDNPQSPDLSSAGLEPDEHPWLVATAELPDDTTIHTGRISLTAEPWLADHAVWGMPLLPATGILDLLLHGATRSGCDRLEDVVLHAPLRLTDDFVNICVRVESPDNTGQRRIGLHSRAKNPGAPWVCHAEASALGGSDTPVGTDEAPCPPELGAPIDLPKHYLALERKGYEYGPAFRKMTAAQRVDDHTCHTQTDLAANRPDGPPSTEGFAVHPALLDAALHGALIDRVGQDSDDRQLLLPYAIDSVVLNMRGATALRTTVTRSGPDRLDVHAADTAGRPVITMDGLRLRKVTARTLRALIGAAENVTWRTTWRPVGETAATAQSPMPQQVNDSVAALVAALPDETQAPEVLLLDCRADRTPHTASAEAGDLATRVRDRLSRLLGDVQAFLTEPRLEGSRLVLLTHGAHSTHPGEGVEDMAAAACAGMVRAVQRERPGSMQLVDVGSDMPDAASLAAAIATGAPEIAMRGGQVLVPRLVSTRDDERLHLPSDGAPWQLVPAASHTIQDIGAVPAPERAGPLADDHVRVRVQVTGMNFRDAFVSLGLMENTPLGCEVAGVVIGTGARTTGWRVGDVVAGLALGTGGYSPLVDIDHRHLIPVLPEWTVAEAAGVPAVFFTAYHALYEVAELKRGDKILVHAAAGGLGMAAVQLARARGAEIYATASPQKHRIVADMGVPPDRIANSRTLDFEPELRRATGGTGFDVIIGSLTGEFVDASLRLLRPDGQYLEIGKADVRDPEKVKLRHPGAVYRHCGIDRAHVDAFQRAFAELTPLFKFGALRPLPTLTRDVRYLRPALRDLSQGRTVAKTVLTQPIELDPDGTVLITGGTGTLGCLLATHLAASYRVRHLLLVSRSGEQAPGAAELMAELSRRGTEVTIATCDVTDRGALGDMIASIPANRPLTAVVHAAGALDDGLVTAQTPERFENVLRVKVDALLNLHDLTRHMSLRAFVIYTSFAGSLGIPGQSGYAAANAFLEAFANHRRRRGLPAVAIAWGLWQEASGLTAHLTAIDVKRFAELGVVPMTTRQGLCGFDTALDLDLPQVTVAALERLTDDQSVPDLLADLPRHHVVRAIAQREGGGSAGPQTLDRTALLAMPSSDRLNLLTNLVCEHAAAILGHTGFEDVPVDQPFRSAGFDSLASVELRTRLGNALGVRLVGTAIFDHPTPQALARHVGALLTTSAELAAETGEHVDPVVAAVLGAWQTGDLPGVHRMLDEMSHDRPTSGVCSPSSWQLLTDIPAHHQIVCLPPILALPGASPYSGLAVELAGVCETWTADLPGYRAGESVPRSLPEMFDSWTAGLPIDPARPVHVLGCSTSGGLAHELVGALRRHAIPVCGMILLDPATPETQPASSRDAVIDRLARDAARIDTAMLHAAYRYEQLLAGWTPEPLDVPILVVQPHDNRRDDFWPPSERVAGAAVSGSSLSMLEEHAAETAGVVSDWLGRMAG
jgi:acyl transferase domain-containing protein/NADPH:quinone reductase-like Zn-dependent oxidoreductase/acyl carrier protein